MSVIRNERVKIASNFTTALGAALIGFSLLKPLADGANLSWAVGWWVLTGLALHGVSYYILRYMKP